MKKCPYCAEEIQDEAIKCKHCGEILNKQETIFSYRAKDQNGAYRDGTIQALNQNGALDKLEAQGLVVISIKTAEIEKPSPSFPLQTPTLPNKAPILRINRGWLILAIIMIVAAVWSNLTNPYKQKKSGLSIKKVESARMSLPVKEFNPATIVSERLGVSYDQMMNYLSNFFVMEMHPLRGGEPRYLGTTVNKYATLELIGEKDNLRKTTLAFGLPSDSTDIFTQNTAILLRFLKNIFPGRDEEVRNWVSSKIAYLSTAENSSDQAIFGDKKVSILIIKKFGLISLTVEGL